MIGSKKSLKLVNRIHLRKLSMKVCQVVKCMISLWMKNVFEYLNADYSRNIIIK